MLGKVQNFLSEVVVELKKVSWPTRQELYQATWIVIISTFLMGIFIGITDFGLARVLGLVIR